MPAEMTLDGRTALVTGGARGIGRACAIRLAEAGAAVTLLDRAEAEVQALAAELGAKAVVADLSDVDTLDRLGLTADILINNAGIQHVAPVQEFPPETFALMMRVMVEAPFRLARGCLPGMYQRGWGRIVNISSVHGVRASPYKAAYVTAKHALEGLSKVLALEGASRGVTSNCVNPAYVRTMLVEQQIASQAAQHGIAERDVLRDVMLAPTAIKRLVEPDEVADMVAYLCGPQASFITGASIMLDGGWSIH